MYSIHNLEEGGFTNAQSINTSFPTKQTAGLIKLTISEKNKNYVELETLEYLSELAKAETEFLIYLEEKGVVQKLCVDFSIFQ